MALSQKHRIALYQHFEPQVGEDVTEALLSEFPAHDGDELVTKAFLRAEVAQLRVEMHQLMNRSTGVLLAAMAVMTAILALVA